MNLINGEWLAEALDAQGESLNSAARRISVEPNKLYAHRAGKRPISTEVLAALSQAMPTLSERYILTGKGPTKRSQNGIDEELVLDAGRAKQLIERILAKLMPSDSRR